MKNGGGWRAWALGLTVLLSLSFGGVIYADIVQRLGAAEAQGHQHAVSIAVLKATLERMEATLDRVERNTRASRRAPLGPREDALERP